MKNHLQIILFLLCSHGVQAQATWQTMSNFPGISRDDASGIVCKGYGYMGTGFGVGFLYLNDWWRYDFMTDTWTPRASLPADPRQYTAIATANDQVYLLGGITPSGCTDELWAYHITTDEWELVTHFPGGGRQAPVLAAFGNKLYAGLGRCVTTYYNDWWEFDLVSLTWKELTSFPGEARFDPVQAMVNEDILVGAGLAASGGKQDGYAYVPAFDLWKPVADFPGCGIFYTVQGAQDKFLYVINGAEADYDFCPGAWRYIAGYYDDSWNNWDVEALDPIRRGGINFVYEGRFYYVGGLDTMGNRLNKVQAVALSNETGIADNDWVLYPTLAENEVCLESKNQLPSTLALFNAAGQKIPFQVPAQYSGYARLDVSALSPGVYILLMGDETGEKIGAKKFFKL